MPIGKDTEAVLAAYGQALRQGADRETALDVALAKMRATCPAAQEWEVRTALAKALAAQRSRDARLVRSP